MEKRDPEWYPAYLRSHHWRRIRKETVTRAKFTCKKCGRRDKHRDSKRGSRLHVHHKTYDRVGKERRADLEALCWSCHKQEHGKQRSLLGRLIGKFV